MNPLVSIPMHYARAKALIPGVLVCAVIALASTFLAEHYGGSQLLYALLIGLSFHFLYSNDQAAAGINFCGRTLLRLGVALLGARITINEIADLGIQTAAVVAFALVATIVLGITLARFMGRRSEEGLISGGSVAICGASAALAVASVLPPTRDNERYTLMVVMAVTVLSTIAMVVYPFLTQMLGLSVNQAGIFLGGTIHDVAQVVAAGMMLGPEAGETATVVKLFRVMLLMPVVFVIAWLYGKRSDAAAISGKVPLVPWFLVLFMILVAVASSGVLAPAVVEQASAASRTFLVIAIAAAGIKTSFADLRQLGWAPIVMLIVETLFIGAFVLAAVLLLGLGG